MRFGNIDLHLLPLPDGQSSVVFKGPIHGSFKMSFGDLAAFVDTSRATQSEDGLLPCLFCGREPRLEQSDGRHFLKCHSQQCPMENVETYVGTKEEITKYWNTRFNPLEKRY